MCGTHLRIRLSRDWRFLGQEDYRRERWGRGSHGRGLTFTTWSQWVLFTHLGFAGDFRKAMMEMWNYIREHW